MDNNPSTTNIEMVDGEESWVHADPETDPFSVLREPRWFMRHEMERDWDRVHPRLFVGGVWYSKPTIENICAEGFTHIFDCCKEHDRQAADLKALFSEKGISYNWVGTHDDLKSKLTEPWLFRGIPKIAEAVRNPDSKVLVHCAAGYNRGPSMGYAALRSLGMTRDQAFNAIDSVRMVGIAYKDDVDIVLEILKGRGLV